MNTYKYIDNSNLSPRTVILEVEAETIGEADGIFLKTQGKSVIKLPVSCQITFNSNLKNIS